MGLEAITPALVAVGCVELLAFPVAAWLVKRYLGRRLDHMDEKRDEARQERKEASIRAAEQREAERTIILAMSRTMLLDNYEKCCDKGCYSIEEREVYHKLYQAYKSDGGNSVIDEIAPRIRALPLEPPEERRDK